MSVPTILYIKGIKINLPHSLNFCTNVSILVIGNRERIMIKYDLYIRGNEPGLDAIKQLVTGIAERTGCITDDESRMNIPLGIVMQVLTGDALHLGLLIGMNTEDPYCVVLRIECEDIMPLHDALIECFGGIDIEMDEDVDDVPWPFE